MRKEYSSKILSTLLKNGLKYRKIGIFRQLKSLKTFKIYVAFCQSFHFVLFIVDKFVAVWYNPVNAIDGV